MSQRLIRREAVEFMQDYLLSVGEFRFLHPNQEKQPSFQTILDAFTERFSADTRTISTFSDLLQASLTYSPQIFTQLRNQLQIPTRTPLTQVVSLVEAQIAENGGASEQHYEQFFEWNMIQTLLRDETRFTHQMEDRRLHHFIQNQAADEYRSIVETASNAIDFSESDGQVEVHIRPNGYVVRDYGVGMTVVELFEKLLIPYASGARAVDKAAIGKFGLGFYTIFSHLRHDGDTVRVKTCRNGKKYQLDFIYDRGEIYLIPVKNCDIERGTEISVFSDSFEPHSAEKSLVDHLQFKRNAVITLHREYGNANADADASEEMQTPATQINAQAHLKTLVHTHSALEETALQYTIKRSGSKHTGTVSFLINGVLVERHALPGKNVPLELVLDFPYTANLPEARNEVSFDQTIARSFLVLILEISESNETTENKIQLFNALAESIQFFSQRISSDPVVVQQLFHEIQTHIAKICYAENICMLPDIPGIENLHIDARTVCVSIVVTGLKLVDVPGIERVPNISSKTLVLYTAPFIGTANVPTVFYENVIILDRNVYVKHKEHPVFLNAYLHELAYSNDQFSGITITPELQAHDVQAKTDYPIFLERHITEEIHARLSSRVSAETLFQYIAFPDNSLNSGLFRKMVSKYREEMSVSVELQRLFAAFIVGDDIGNVQRLIDTKISIDEFCASNSLTSQRDKDAVEKLVNSRGEFLSAIHSMISCMYEDGLNSAVLTSSPSILSWYQQYIQKIQNTAFFKDFTSETQELFTVATSPTLLWENGKSLLDTRIGKLKYQGATPVKELVFLYVLKQRVTDLKDIYEYLAVTEQHTDIAPQLETVLAVDWYSDAVAYKPSELGAFTEGWVAILRGLENPEQFIEDTLLPLLELFPYISRKSVFELLFASVDPDTMSRLNASIQYRSWAEFFVNRELAKYDNDYDRSRYLSKTSEYANHGVQILENLKRNISSMLRLSTVVTIIDGNTANSEKLLLSSGIGKSMREYGGNEYRQLAPIRNVLNDPTPYLSTFTVGQLAYLNEKTAIECNPMEMSTDKLHQFYYVLQSALRLAHLSDEKFAFAIDLLYADEDYTPGYDVHTAVLQPYLFESQTFDILFEKRWIFAILPLSLCVAFWRKIQHKSSTPTIDITPQHLHRLLTIFEALAYKSQQTREEILLLMRKASPYTNSSSYDYFRLERISIAEVPAEIRPYVIYFRNDVKQNGAHDQLLKNTEGASSSSLAAMALAKRLHTHKYIQAVGAQNVHDFVHEVTHGKNTVVSRRELIHAVNHLPTNDPYLFLRELMQNMIDAVATDGSSKTISIKDYYAGEHFVVEVSDPVGMPPETALADLIVPGFSSKKGSELGRFGIGFLSVLKDAQKVEIVTDDGATRTEILLVPIYDSSGELFDFTVSYSFSESQGRGTTIRKYMHFSDGAIESAFMEDAVYRYARYLDSRVVQVMHNEKQVNTEQVVLARVEHAVIGPTEILESSESALLQGSLQVCDLPDYLQDLIPPALYRFFDTFGLVLNLSKEVELLRTRNDIARRQLYVEHFRQVLPELFIKALIERYVSGTFDLSLLPYDFYFFDGSPANSNWQVEHWIQLDADRIQSGEGVENYDRYVSESEILQLLVSIKKFAVDDEMYSLRDIVIRVNNGQLTDYSFLPSVVSKKLDDAKERKWEIQFQSRLTKMEHRIHALSVTEELQRLSPTHAAFVWLVTQLTPNRMQKGMNIVYYYLPDGSIAHAQPYTNSKGWNLHREYFDHELATLCEYLATGNWNREFESVLRSIFKTSTHEDTHLSQRSTCDDKSGVAWTGSHNSVFTRAQVIIMGQALYDIDLEAIRVGLQQFAAVRLDSSRLLRELGYFDS